MQFTTRLIKSGRLSEIRQTAVWPWRNLGERTDPRWKPPSRTDAWGGGALHRAPTTCLQFWRLGPGGAPGDVERVVPLHGCDGNLGGETSASGLQARRTESAPLAHHGGKEIRMLVVSRNVGEVVA